MKSRRFLLLSRVTDFCGVVVGADNACIIASGIGVDGSAGRDGDAGWLRENDGCNDDDDDDDDDDDNDDADDDKYDGTDDKNDCVYVVENDGAGAEVSVSIEVVIVGDAALKKEVMVGVICEKATEVGGTGGVRVSLRNLAGGFGMSTILQLSPRTFFHPCNFIIRRVIASSKLPENSPQIPVGLCSIVHCAPPCFSPRCCCRRYVKSFVMPT